MAIARGTAYESHNHVALCGCCDGGSVPDGLHTFVHEVRYRRCLT